MQSLGIAFERALSSSQRECFSSLAYTGLCLDSRLLEPGDLFICTDRSPRRETFFCQATANGAIGIVMIGEDPLEGAVEKPVDVFKHESQSIPLLNVAASKTILKDMASSYYTRRPGLSMAVTGTNGKTSVSFFASQMAAYLGYPTLVMGTLGDFVFAPEMTSWRRGTISLTTPDIFSLYRTLQKAHDEGIKAYVMEVSSHALTQDRLGNLRFDVVAMTNVMPEHLDYHQTFEAYLAAKCRLFSDYVSNTGVGVVNADSPHVQEFIQIFKGKKILSYGRDGKDIRLEKLTSQVEGSRLTFEWGEAVYEQNINFLGTYQGMNVLCAMGMVMGGFSSTGFFNKMIAQEIIKALPQLVSPTGRMQFMGKTLSGGVVYVDYAHTVDAYEIVLSQVKEHVRGRLIVLFGCGGDRDTQKRPLMGEVAGRYADVVYLTDDNPRTEDPAKIRQQIRSGMEQSACEIVEIPDRQRGIQMALRGLAEGDILILLGKGHETYQQVGGMTYAHSDQESVRAALDQEKSLFKG